MGGRGRRIGWSAALAAVLVMMVGAVVPATATVVWFEARDLVTGALAGNELQDGVAYRVEIEVEPAPGATGWELVVNSAGADVALEPPLGCEGEPALVSQAPLTYRCTTPAVLDAPAPRWRVEVLLTPQLNGQPGCAGGAPCIDVFLAEIDDLTAPLAGEGRTFDVVAPPPPPSADLVGGLTIVAGDPDADRTILTGDTVTVRVAATNFGPDPATDVIAHLELPTEVTLAELDLPADCTFSPGAITAPSRVTCALGTVAVGIGAGTSRDLVITPDDPMPHVVDLVALTSTSTDPVASNHDASLTVQVDQRTTDLAATVVTTNVPDRLLPGLPVETTVVVENLGPDAAPGTVLTVEALTTTDVADIAAQLAFPSGCTLDSAAPPTVTCELDLAAFDGVASSADQFVLPLEVTWDQPGTWTVRASVDGPGQDPSSANDVDTATVVVVTPTADLSVVPPTVTTDVDGDGVVHAGDPHGLLTSVVNGGPEPATGVELFVTVDRPAADVTLDGVGCTPTVAAPETTAMVCDVADLAPASSAFVAMSVAVDTPGPATVGLLASSTASDPGGSLVELPLDVRDPLADADGDGIAGGVDGARVDPDDPTTFLLLDETGSVTFSDQSRPRSDGPGFGETTGQVLTTGATNVVITDAADDDLGVVVTTAATPVSLLACGTVVDVAADSEVVLTCGSITVDVLVGEAVVELGDGVTLVVPAGTTVRVVEDGSGGVDLEVAGGPALLLDGETTIELGEGDHTVGTVDAPDVAPLAAYVDGVPDDALANRGVAHALASVIDDVADAVAVDARVEALEGLDVLDKRADGCPGAADRDDWVVDCDVQAALRQLVAELRGAILAAGTG